MDLKSFNNMEIPRIQIETVMFSCVIYSRGIPTSKGILAFGTGTAQGILVF